MGNADFGHIYEIFSLPTLLMISVPALSKMDLQRAAALSRSAKVVLV